MAGPDGPTAGLADSGDVEADLTDCFAAAGDVARDIRSTAALFVDELQRAGRAELRALLGAAHRARQQGARIVLIGAGLPSLAQEARSASAEPGQVDVVSLGALAVADAVSALQRPAEGLGVRFTNEALAEILLASERHPYFLQQWAYVSWDRADRGVIAREAVQSVAAVAEAELDAAFFGPLVINLTPPEAQYARAMARCGPSPASSGHIARELGRPVTAVAPTRASLIAKGVIHSPSRGLAAFTSPQMDQFFLRSGL